MKSISLLAALLFFSVNVFANPITPKNASFTDYFCCQKGTGNIYKHEWYNGKWNWYLQETNACYCDNGNNCFHKGTNIYVGTGCSF